MFRTIYLSYINATESVSLLTESKQMTDEDAMHLKASMLNELGMEFIVVEKKEDLKALADKRGIPERIAKALADAQARMKK